MRAWLLWTGIPLLSLALFITLVPVQSLIDMPLSQGEAAVWYLFHSGWAVKTSSVLMIFDYLTDSPEQGSFSLSDGVVNPNAIKDQRVYVFISHRHGDHFDQDILEWKKVVPDITYVFGWESQMTQSGQAFGKDRISKSIGPLKIKNIFHKFDDIPESAFLIEVDGLTIYFSGDHGNARGDLNPIYKDNIDYLSRQCSEFDLVFLSIFGSPTYEGELFALERFKPKVTLPMHNGGREADAESFVRLAKLRHPKVEFWFPMKKGDGFLYKNGHVSPFK